jgi:hypothetical protein
MSLNSTDIDDKIHRFYYDLKQYIRRNFDLPDTRRRILQYYFWAAEKHVFILTKSILTISRLRDLNKLPKSTKDLAFLKEITEAELFKLNKRYALFIDAVRKTDASILKATGKDHKIAGKLHAYYLSHLDPDLYK